eukprot:CAMPEP_0206189936 /NCGR_PEP_ID=MMETSP0166-20121206/4451_1 /ASSEMBLY_ACC=CAM_ASM_000260 /TAXON_ID=95228 /ORGANISM="Vannella robusta, Strain DIVA3 518/3/11/1/6" /LENGTH=765 /DNA_ID=CAMNT_0053605919 /DNA_START=579 /DNA_END=2872 /DNA_ORIENTATION=+
MSSLVLRRVVRRFVFSRTAATSARYYCDHTAKEVQRDQEFREKLDAANDGNVQAQLYLANYYSTGVNTRKDINKAVDWLQKAVNAGSSVAKVVLASTWLNTTEHLDEDSKNKRIKEGINLLNSAAEQEDAVALQKLAVHHLQGSLVPKDIDRAIEMLQKACKVGNSTAEYELGKLYINGVDVDQNVELGLKHLQNAMKAGDSSASEFFYDFLYQRALKAGGNELQNYVNYLSRGAQSNDPLSLHFLGLFILQHHESIGKDVKEAIKLISKASDKGFVPSHCAMGDLHRTGAISPGNPDFKAAYNYYKMAADQEYGAGFHGLGLCYLEGLAVQKDYGKAEELFRSALASGYVPAHSKLGAMQYNGFGMKKNVHAALNHFQAAIKVGDKEAMYHLGLHFGNTGNIEQAVKFLDEASLAIPDAGYNLGMMYLSGIDKLDQDSQKALQYLERSAGLSSGAAICKLGLIYFEGANGIQKDHEKAKSYWKHGCQLNNSQCFHNMGMLTLQSDAAKAAEYFQQAADRNVIESQEKLGMMYLHGNGVEQDVQKGTDLLHGAAEAGNLFSQVQLGLCYSDGKLVPVDLDLAIAYFKKAAEIDPSVNHVIGTLYRKNGNQQLAIEHFKKGGDAGHDYSQIELAYMHYCGNGVEKNLDTAAFWYQKAAEQKNSLAMHNLGMMFMEGEHQPKDEAKGLEFITESAELGNVTAQTNLGIIYWNGSETISPDVEQAKLWWEKASEQQNSEAMYNLGELYMAGYDSVKQDRAKGLDLIST